MRLHCAFWVELVALGFQVPVPWVVLVKISCVRVVSLSKVAKTWQKTWQISAKFCVLIRNRVKRAYFGKRWQKTWQIIRRFYFKNSKIAFSVIATRSIAQPPKGGKVVAKQWQMEWQKFEEKCTGNICHLFRCFLPSNVAK